jgi:hypothetical protein
MFIACLSRGEDSLPKRLVDNDMKDLADFVVSKVSSLQ